MKDIKKLEIKTFKDLIYELKPNYHSFDIKRDNWEKRPFWSKFEKFFKKEKSITISRFDLRNSGSNIEEYTLKTILWGYPTVGRGTNIEALLETNNFKKLINTLESYIENNIELDQLKKDINRIDGLGVSTMTKFIHFLNTSVDGFQSLILDKRIIDVISLDRFVELDSLSKISYSNAINKYTEYLKLMDEISNSIEVDHEQLEMFLFMFGRNLSQPLGGEAPK
jgi:hypothetical protein